MKESGVLKDGKDLDVVVTLNPMRRKLGLTADGTVKVEDQIW